MMYAVKNMKMASTKFKCTYHIYYGLYCEFLYDTTHITEL